MRSGNWLSVGMLLTLGAGVAAGGPWALLEGESYTSMTATVTRYDQLELYNGQRVSAQNLRFFGVSVAADYGLTDDVSLSLALPYEVARGDSAAASPRVAALGDLRFAARRQVWNEADHRFALAGGVGLKIPLSNYRTEVLSAPGDGQIDLEWRVLAGQTLGSAARPVYWEAEVGYRLRFGSPGDELLFYAEIGKQLAERWHGRVFLDRVDQRSGFGLQEPGWVPGDFPSIKEDLDLLGVGVSYALRDDLTVDAFYARLVRVENSALGWHFGVSLVSHRMPF